MELPQTATSTGCITAWMEMQAKVPAIALSTPLHPIASFISFQMLHILRRPQEAVYFTLEMELAHAICGMMDYLSYGRTSLNYSTRTLTMA